MQDRMEPVSLDAALTWLQHCQRFNLCLAVPVSALLGGRHCP